LVITKDEDPDTELNTLGDEVLFGEVPYDYEKKSYSTNLIANKKLVVLKMNIYILKTWIWKY
jgi:hypothetical protein